MQGPWAFMTNEVREEDSRFRFPELSLVFQGEGHLKNVEAHHRCDRDQSLHDRESAKSLEIISVDLHRARCPQMGGR
jgi:hypothetical protein